jgi:hypothetical protein
MAERVGKEEEVDGAGREVREEWARRAGVVAEAEWMDAME